MLCLLKLSSVRVFADSWNFAVASLSSFALSCQNLERAGGRSRDLNDELCKQVSFMVMELGRCPLSLEKKIRAGCLNWVCDKTISTGCINCVRHTSIGGPIGGCRTLVKRFSPLPHRHPLNGRIQTQLEKTNVPISFKFCYILQYLNEIKP